MGDEFNIYRGQDGNVDYSSAVATMDLTDTEVQIAAQDKQSRRDGLEPSLFPAVVD